jgi:DNA-binding MarR family transcriptional regulator
MVASLATIAAREAGSEHVRLRLWVRLLRVTRQVEGKVRERLKAEFDMTLPRFDVLAALYRRPDGMLMSEISSFLLVSNGNITGIVERLVEAGLVLRTQHDSDRRAFVARLSPAGIAAFEAMARAHEAWIDELLGEIGETESRQLGDVLGAFRSDWE